MIRYLRNQKQFYKELGNYMLYGTSFKEDFQNKTHYFSVWKSFYLWFCIIGFSLLLYIAFIILGQTTDLTIEGKVTILIPSCLVSILLIYVFNLQDLVNNSTGSYFYAYQIRKKIAKLILNSHYSINAQYVQEEIKRYQSKILTLHELLDENDIAEYCKENSINTLGYQGKDLVDMWVKYERPLLIQKIKRQIDQQKDIIKDYDNQKAFCETLLKS